jgi:hypothetical protein
MSGAPDAREAPIIVEVVRGVLRDRGAGGLVLVTPPGPEATLLEGWFTTAAIPVLRPGPRQVARLLDAFRDAGPAGDAGEDGGAAEQEEAWRAAGRVLAHREGFLPAHAVNRTALLLLGAALPPEPLLPLGDMPASRVLELTGACSLPEPFGALGRDPAAVAAVDRFLAHREGRLPGDAPPLPAPLEAGILRRLAAGRWAMGAAVVIPRLGARTPGADLAGR